MNQRLMNPPRYKSAPIQSLNALARALGEPWVILHEISQSAGELYRPAREIQKSDGTIRYTFDALPNLKKIQQKIKCKILDQVEFPPYLTGSIKGCDCKTNASLHTGARWVICEDIKGFFPATTRNLVFDIWYGFFGFSPEVADCLTCLTSKDDTLPQGAITSSHLANLVFWRQEPALQGKFAERGIVYSRYVDDISISSKQFITPEGKTHVICALYGMLFKHGYGPKRNKHELQTSGERMLVTKQVINEKPSLPRQKRSQIRATVFQLEQEAKSIQNHSYLNQKIRKTIGQIGHLARFHPHEAQRLKVRLLAISSLQNTKAKVVD